MLIIYFLRNPLFWAIPFILQTVAYFSILTKMGLRRWTSVIPFLAERDMTVRLFGRRRTFYRPFTVAVFLLVTAYYLGSASSWAIALRLVSFTVYGVFLLRLYWRLGKSFNKNFFFRIALILFPAVCLLILGLGKSVYAGLKLKPRKKHSKPVEFLHAAALFLVSVCELLLLIGACSFIVSLNRPPRFMVNQQLESYGEKFKEIKAADEVISAEDMIADFSEGKTNTEDTPEKLLPSREHFFPDHSHDQNVVVMAYVIGSNLENRSGLASANIQQMIDATDMGDHLTFVMEAGGSERWFTKGIDDYSYGRYEIKSGELTCVEKLPSDTCLSEENELTDFITWARDHYEADRYMLVLWDHGGGFTTGYGMDDLNEKQTESDEMPVISSTEIISAIDKAGVTFDIIGFDACLMQDIELAAAIEPYTDYYLASEEVEGGFGWYYTEAFGQLAQTPGMSSEDFAVNLLSCYDQLNAIVKGGEIDTGATLSFVDTALAKSAYEELNDLFYDMEKAIERDPGAYASVAAAGNNAYRFNGNYQIDLIDFLQIMGKADYENLICTEEELNSVIEAIMTSVLYRNKNSAEGINGVALSFPYTTIRYYDIANKELKNLSLDQEEKTFSLIFSIMAAQQKAEADKRASEADQNVGILYDLAELLAPGDYTEADWYIAGFEDYSTAQVFLDIPLTLQDEGYRVELPEKAWNTIIECKTALYQKVSDEENADVVYLGCDYTAGEDENGYALIGITGDWLYIEDQLVCYEADPIRETKEGLVFTGKVPARLNGDKDILLHIEWDHVEDDETSDTAHITGYEFMNTVDLLAILSSKGNLSLNPGDKIQFIYDTYDAEGNLVKAEPQGKTITVTQQDRLEAKEAPIGDSTVIFNGVLTDMYQRIMTTEHIEVQIGPEAV